MNDDELRELYLSLRERTVPEGNGKPSANYFSRACIRLGGRLATGCSRTPVRGSGYDRRAEGGT